MNNKVTPGGLQNVVEDWQAAYSARYILEDLNNEDGMTKLAELTGMPMGVIIFAFKNLFPDQKPIDEN